jgi:hypothetical protein
VGSELSIIPSEYMVDVPEGEVPPPEFEGATKVYPIILEADAPWSIEFGAVPPEGYVVATDANVEVDMPESMTGIGLKELSEQQTPTGAAIAGADEGQLVMEVKAKHPDEADWKQQTVTSTAEFEPVKETDYMPVVMSLLLIAGVLGATIFVLTRKRI